MENQCLNWEECYDNNPLNVVHFGARESNNPNTLGFEACAWELTEQTFEKENIWMRLIGTTEHMWSSPRDNFLKRNDSTKRRILGFCKMLGNLNLFPNTMCSDAANSKKSNVKESEDFQRRSSEEDHLVCKRSSKGKRICSTSNCKHFPESY